MHIVETTNEGLKRAYAVTIPAATIAARVEGEIKKIAPQVRMPGFRPGKVPANLVRKLHGEALHQDALQGVIRESLDQLVREHALRPAMQPEVTLGEGYAQGADAALSVALEVLPEVTAPAIDGLKLEKLVVPVTDADLDAALARLGDARKSWSDAEEGTVAAEGHQLVLDFVGKLDGEVFEGGSMTDAKLELGSGQFIPGFESQLIGVTAGEERTITVTFPEDYGAAHLAGREATFEITVKAVQQAGEFVADDEFAKTFGLDSIEVLRNILRSQLENETAGLTRTQMKRALLDQLAAGHDFAVPESMVEAEFNQIWEQLSTEAEREADPVAARAEIEAERDDYRRIAERRVRLGLLLSEIGQANGVVVSHQEMDALIRQAQQQYRPEDRQRFAEYIRSDALAAAQLRAPLYEDKVVDFLFDKAEVTTREVTREELEAAIEAGDTAETPAAADAIAAVDAEAPAAEAPAADATEADATEAEAPAPRKRAAKKAATDEGDAAEGDKPAPKKRVARKTAEVGEAADAAPSDSEA